MQVDTGELQGCEFGEVFHFKISTPEKVNHPNPLACALEGRDHECTNANPLVYQNSAKVATSVEQFCGCDKQYSGYLAEAA